MSIACEAADSSHDEDLCPRVMDALERRRAALVSPVSVFFFFLSVFFLSFVILPSYGFDWTVLSATPPACMYDPRRVFV